MRQAGPLPASHNYRTRARRLKSRQTRKGEGNKKKVCTQNPVFWAANLFHNQPPTWPVSNRTRTRYVSKTKSIRPKVHTDPPRFTDCLFREGRASVFIEIPQNADRVVPNGDARASFRYLQIQIPKYPLIVTQNKRYRLIRDKAVLSSYTCRDP